MRVKITVRPPEYDAIQYTGDNEADVAAFVGFLFRRSSGDEPPAIYDPIGQYLRPLAPGSWITAIGTTMSVLTPTEFAAAYNIVA